MKWFKMGCGHLVALPLLLFSLIPGIGFFVALANGRYYSKALIDNGIMALVTGGIASGLLVYL